MNKMYFASLILLSAFCFCASPFPVEYENNRRIAVNDAFFVLDTVESELLFKTPTVLEQGQRVEKLLLELYGREDVLRVQTYVLSENPPFDLCKDTILCSVCEKEVDDIYDKFYDKTLVKIFSIAEFEVINGLDLEIGYTEYYFRKKNKKISELVVAFNHLTLFRITYYPERIRSQNPRLNELNF